MKIIKLEEIKNIIRSGSTIAIGGFTINRKPMALIKKISESQLENLSVFTLSGAIDIDLLLKKKKIKKIFAAYIGYEGLGISFLFRKSVENNEVEIEDLTEILYYLGLKAGAMGVPFIPTKSIVNSDIFKISSVCFEIKNPDSDDRLCAVKAINPDFCLIHAQKADAFGNIQINETDFCEKEMVQASKIRIFSVEEIVKKLKPSEITISNEFVDYVVISKNGALPTGCRGHYPPDIKEIMGFLEHGNQ